MKFSIGLNVYYLICQVTLGLKSYICSKSNNTSKRSIVVESKLNLARPIILSI